MQVAKNEEKERILLELIFLCDIGLSPDVVERNWNVDPKESRPAFESLKEKNYLEHIGDEVYVPTEKAYSFMDEQPMTRSIESTKSTLM